MDSVKIHPVGFATFFGTVLALAIMFNAGCGSDDPTAPDVPSNQPKIEGEIDSKQTKPNRQKEKNNQNESSQNKRIKAKASKLQFVSKKIQINVSASGNEVAIAGRFMFRNILPKRWSNRIYFPFFIDKNHPRPTTIKVKPGRFNRHKQGIAYKLIVGPNKTKEVTVAYKQQAPRQTATYRVTSAMGWGKNIEYARFDLVLPSKFKLKDASYPLRLKSSDGQQQHFQFATKNFTPDKEFTVKWEKK